MRIFGRIREGTKPHELYPGHSTLSYCSVALLQSTLWEYKEPPADLCKNCKRAREAHR